jgi:hypothetical protein
VDDHSEFTSSHLFVIRIWEENLGNDQVECRGQVQDVLSGESRYFRDWPTLISFFRLNCSRLDAGVEPDRPLSK